MPPVDERGCLLAEEAATAAAAAATAAATAAAAAVPAAAAAAKAAAAAVPAAAKAAAAIRTQKIKDTNSKNKLLKNCFKKNTARFIARHYCGSSLEEICQNLSDAGEFVNFLNFYCQRSVSFFERIYVVRTFFERNCIVVPPQKICRILKVCR